MKPQAGERALLHHQQCITNYCYYSKSGNVCYYALTTFTSTALITCFEDNYTETNNAGLHARNYARG